MNLNRLGLYRESNLFYLSSGFLLGGLPLFSTEMDFNKIILMCFSILICYYFKKLQIALILLGTVLGIGYTKIEEFKHSQSIDRIFTIEEFQLHSESNSTIQITFLDEVRKNIYRVSTSIGSREYYFYLNYFSRERDYLTLNCESKDLNAYEIQDSDYYLKSIPQSYKHIWKLRKNSCNAIHKRINFRKQFAMNIRALIHRGKIGRIPEQLVMGFLFGDSSYLDKGFKNRAKEGGILHLFAASGLHMGIFLGSLIWFFSKLPFLGYSTEKILPVILGFSYIYMLNFPVSLTRAYMFAILLLISKLGFRRIRPLQLILYSIVLIRVIFPEDYFSISFLLSYGAVISILLLMSPIRNLLFGSKKGFIIENVSLSISAGLGTFPVLIYYFGSYSLGSTLINIIIVPITAFLLPFLYLALAFEFLNIYFIKELTWVWVEIVLRLIIKLSETLGSEIGFYREFLEHKEVILYGYLLFMVFTLLLLWAHFLVSSLPKLKMNLFLRMGFTGLYIFVFYLFYSQLFHLSDSEKREKKYAGIDLYFVRSERNVFLGGSCKYNQQLLYDIKRNGDCKYIKEFHFSNQNCLEFALKCAENAKLYYHNQILEVDLVAGFSEIQIISQKIPRVFSGEENFYVFSPNKDSLNDLVQFTKEKSGLILLQLPYKSRDNSKEWNESKKYLGINENWKFVTSEELEN